jgi:hypothetical protein
MVDGQAREDVSGGGRGKMTPRRLRRFCGAYGRLCEFADGLALTPALRRPLLDELGRNVRPFVVSAPGDRTCEEISRAKSKPEIRRLHFLKFPTPPALELDALLRRDSRSYPGYGSSVSNRHHAIGRRPCR